MFKGVEGFYREFLFYFLKTVSQIKPPAVDRGVGRPRRRTPKN